MSRRTHWRHCIRTRCRPPCWRHQPVQPSGRECSRRCYVYSQCRRPLSDNLNERWRKERSRGSRQKLWARAAATAAVARAAARAAAARAVARARPGSSGCNTCRADTFRHSTARLLLGTRSTCSAGRGKHIQCSQQARHTWLRSQLGWPRSSVLHCPRHSGNSCNRRCTALSNTIGRAAAARAAAVRAAARVAVRAAVVRAAAACCTSTGSDKYYPCQNSCTSRMGYRHSGIPRLYTSSAWFGNCRCRRTTSS